MAPDADRPRSDAGRYDDRIDPDTVLDVFDARADQARPLTAGDVVDEMGIARRTAHNKLNALVERGVLETRKVGARGRVWWTPARQASDSETARETAETPSAVSGDRTDTASNDREHRATETGEADGQADLDAAIAAVDTPGSGKTKQEREAALRRAYQYLKDHGEAQRKDFKELLGDDVGYASFSSWWTNYVKAKDALKQLPHVDAPAEGEHTWTYTGATETEQADAGGGGVYDPTEEFDS
jgi:hypothetical protein